MKTKQEILTDVQEGLATGVLTTADLTSLVAANQEQSVPSSHDVENKPEKLSAVDVMFYVAGIVLFSTIMSIIVQSWNDGSALIHILLSAFVGGGLWLLAYSLLGNPLQSEVRKGLTNALLLTGSLLIIVGGYIITNTIIGGFDEVNYMPAALTLAILGVIHIGFDKLIKHDLILCLGVLLVVSSFPALLFGLLQDADVPMDIWSVILVASAGILVAATRLVAKMNPGRPKVYNVFDSFATFLALMSMYVASYGDYGILWFVGLITAIFGIFYLSIALQNKQLLGSGSFFLVLAIVTIAFKYFSGYGVTFSLVLATVGLLGSAALASSINKKYFKQSSSAISDPSS